MLTVTPGFLQPLTPENAALGANGTLSITGYIAEAGGSTRINYALSSTASGSSGGQGSLGSTNCTRSTTAFTYCSDLHRAATISATTGTWSWPPSAPFLADDQRSPAEHGRCLERSGESRSQAGDARLAGQFGRKQQ